ncbi:MAG: SprT family zinc-dependent metalloprotease [Kiritimatiellae bacterium]|nr:SprT family zinc-dependent metalloprotease [Kiritimatiellia bacterium]
MRSTADQVMDVDGKQVEFRVVTSKTARQLRIRVGLDGVEVVKPAARTADEVAGFLARHGGWIADQMERVERLRIVRRPRRERAGRILFRGMWTPVRVERVDGRRGANRVAFDGGVLTVRCGARAGTTVAKSLENWLRKQARVEIGRQLEAATRRLRRRANRLYVMGQRTKWGNCSPLQNLSFTWRLIMAPEHVLRYLVTHEAVHLAVPDHSARFWLTVQSLCPETERARQWLARHGESLPMRLDAAIEGE